ncbi:hypothetical protein ACGFRB_24430 [Streptomyces sp. NPDC048718]|uniref:WapI family immunity protein n=1 Tax=Streptomyces sp. NPDC048718 TaxID=3365587 RepID=UPI00371CD904
MSAWLRAVAAGTIAVTEPGDEGWLSPKLWFLEPVLAFSLAGHTDHEAVVRVHPSLEAAPTWQWEDEGTAAPQYTVEIRMPTAALRDAADRWDHAPAAFPDH